MSGSNFFRLIEDYFNGAISTADQVMLENQLLKDPLLQAEFNLQKNIHEGLSNVRKQELKQRLSAIEMAPVSVGIIQSAAVKWLAATVTAATLLGGVLFYLSGDNNPIIPLDLKQHQAIAFEFNANMPGVPLATTKQTVFEEPSRLSNKLEASVSNEQSQSPSRITAEAQKPNMLKDNETNEIAIKPQSLISFEDENLFNRNESNDLDKIAPVSIKYTTTKETNIRVLEAKEINQYHYQYFNNKLFLYGDFSEEPYEIIELKQKGDRSLYLSYKETVYIIKANVTEITALQSLNDEKLLNELKIISSSR